MADYNNEINNLVYELETLENNSYAYGKAQKPTFGANKEEAEKYTAASKNALLYGIIAAVLFVIRLGLPLGTGIYFFKTDGLTLISLILFIAIFAVDFILRRGLVFKIKTDVRVKICNVVAVLLFAAELFVFFAAYYDNKVFAEGLVCFAVITLLCGYLSGYFIKKQLQNKNVKSDIEARQSQTAATASTKTGKERIDEIKSELYAKGVVYCNENQLFAFTNPGGLIKSNAYGFWCPVCGNKLETDNNYIVRYGGLQKTAGTAILKNGIVLNKNFATTVAYEYQIKTFPATKYHCPHCEYDLFKSNVSVYKDKEVTEQGSDGGYYKSSRKEEEDITLFKLDKGKLYAPVVEKRLNELKASKASGFEIYDKFLVKHAEVKKETLPETETTAVKAEPPVNYIETQVTPQNAAVPSAANSNLITCIDCGKRFSRRAKACPECGCPIEECLKAEK